MSCFYFFTYTFKRRNIIYNISSSTNTESRIWRKIHDYYYRCIIISKIILLISKTLMTHWGNKINKEETNVLFIFFIYGVVVPTIVVVVVVVLAAAAVAIVFDNIL